MNPLDGTYEQFKEQIETDEDENVTPLLMGSTPLIVGLTDGPPGGSNRSQDYAISIISPGAIGKPFMARVTVCFTDSEELVSDNLTSVLEGAVMELIKKKDEANETDKPKRTSRRAKARSKKRK